MQYLNLSYNSLPQDSVKRVDEIKELERDLTAEFMEALVTMIRSASKLIYIGLSGMNFRHHVK